MIKIRLHRLFSAPLLKPSIRVICCGLLPMVLGCGAVYTHLDAEAEKLGFSRNVIQGDEFKHVIFTREGGRHAQVLHVYLDGDGRPWIGNRLIAADPTPENPMMLNLMAVDHAAVIYLGRPCYHGLASSPECDSSLWTSARYSSRVVRSMARALNHFMARKNFREVVLVGYSGGASLAMMLAERIETTRVVVTIAGNLDTDAWTNYHNYSPLEESLNPAARPPLNAEISQYHLIGKADKNVPYVIVEQAIALQPAAEVLTWDHFDHTCCWSTIWPEFLSQLEIRMRKSSLGR